MDDKQATCIKCGKVVHINTYVVRADYKCAVCRGDATPKKGRTHAKRHSNVTEVPEVR